MATFRQRLARTLAQLGLALLNATLILVIVAALAAGFAAHAVNRLTTQWVSSATQAAVRAAGIDPQRLAGELAALHDETAAMRRQLAQRRDEADLGAAVDRIDSRLTQIRDALRAAAHPTIVITPAAVTAAQNALNDGLDRLLARRPLDGGSRPPLPSSSPATD